MDEQNDVPKKSQEAGGEEIEGVSFETQKPNTQEEHSEPVNTQQMKNDAAALGVMFDDSSTNEPPREGSRNTDLPQKRKQGAHLPQDQMRDDENDVVFEQPNQSDTDQTSGPLSQNYTSILQDSENTPDQEKHTKSSSYDPNAVVRSSPESSQKKQTRDTVQEKNTQYQAEKKQIPEDLTASKSDEHIELPREDAGDKTHVPDQRFASRVLAQEQEAVSDKERPAEPQEKSPEPQQKEDVPTQEQAPGKKRRNIPIVRTYKGDVAEALKQNQTSQVQMVLAESQKKQEQKEARSPKSKQNLPLLIGSIVFGAVGLVALAGGAYFFYTSDQSRQPGPAETVEVDSLVFTEAQTEIDITDRSAEAIQNVVNVEMGSLDIRLDHVAHFYFTERVSASDQPSIERETVKTLVSPTRLFDALNSRMPDTLKRALSPEYMYGVHSFNGNQPFIILKTGFFENAFAGMLNWEPFMAREILPLFNIPVTDDIRNKSFTDIVIKNRDLRALLGPNDEEIVLLYTFFDRNTIIITAAEETLEEVIARLQRPTQ